jgi:hypothetical protein
MMTDDNRIGGAASHVPGAAGATAGTIRTSDDEPDILIRNHRPRAPGTPPEAHVLALARLTDGMLMTGSLRPAVLDGFRVALKIAITAAPHGEHGQAVERLLVDLLKRVEGHMAQTPR